jgi:signal transduction histidine kinase
MKQRNLLPLVMMTGSITLLLLLQGLWLVNSYDDANNDLRRRTSDLFRGTLGQMRDSILFRGFEPYADDSVITGSSRAIFLSVPIDSTKERRTERLTQAEVVYKSNGSDSIKIRGNFSHTFAFRDGAKFVLRFSPDSLSPDTIANHFRKALVREDLDLPFKVKMDHQEMTIIDDDLNTHGTKTMRRRIDRMPPPPHDIAEAGSIATDWIVFAPGIHYASIFEDVRPYLFLQISPQLIFSIVLTALTTGAFLMMYRSMRSQQRLMELKNDFISNITHELKTPVTTVSVALEALKNFKGLENPQTTKEYLEIAQGELNRLTMLTDKVLKTAVFDHRGVNFEHEQVDLHKTVDQILHSMKLIFEKQKAHVTFEKKGDSFTIRGGSIHITNVIYNLLDNALKYSGGNPQIAIHLEENDNQVILKIADKGIGIPAEYKKKIFEKFFRVPTGDVHNIKGYGLGLSYVDNVVRSHRGLIEVASRPGEGSVFTISLPKGI